MPRIFTHRELLQLLYSETICFRVEHRELTSVGEDLIFSEESVVPSVEGSRLC